MTDYNSGTDRRIGGDQQICEVMVFCACGSAEPGMRAFYRHCKANGDHKNDPNPNSYTLIPADRNFEPLLDDDRMGEVLEELWGYNPVE